MSSRLIGVAGMMILYGFFMSRKPRPQHYRRIGETLVGLYLFSQSYTFLYSKEDAEAIYRHLPGGDVTLYMCSSIAALGSVAYISSWFVIDITYTLVGFLTVLTLSIDLDISYWTKRRGMDFWNQMQLLADHMCIILGFLMYLACSTRHKLPVTEKTKQDGKHKTRQTTKNSDNTSSKKTQ